MPENVHRTLSDLAALQGRSRSSIIVELLEAVHLPLLRTVALLQAAKDAPEEVKRGLVGTLEEMESRLGAAAGMASSQFDLIEHEINRLSVQPPKLEPNPHVVTRGSASGTTPPEAPRKSSKKPSKTKGNRNG